MSKKVVTSIAVGVVIGLLLAPDKGSETRKKISKTFNNISDTVQDFIDNVKEVVSSFRDEEDELQRSVSEPWQS